ncbi:hypothetical protein [Dyadobacter jiangsuensis]|uniref:Uncharacterized protein n=1 Tax=Dyadobacter jiangsuensis TaxID=1591085 RepID=A0A2P8F925_9BACT|nr:hypothetical protein [Dyadobacter jiangsuensis]PSL18224.1 hypothetical protein CLV60_1324 [Dyadobacter jiangsuensis]
MKSSSFFIEKANEYIAEIDRLTASYIPASSVREKPGHQELSDEISDLKLKIKLLFFEFEHGHLFVEKVTRASPGNGNINQVNDHLLVIFRRYLNLFIEHLQLYRE